MTYCRKCGGVHPGGGCKPRRPGAIDWSAVMAYQVRPGEEMTLEQVGKIAGVSRERIRQVEFDALRKLGNRPSVRVAVAEALRS